MAAAAELWRGKGHDIDGALPVTVARSVEQHGPEATSNVLKRWGDKATAKTGRKVDDPMGYLIAMFGNPANHEPYQSVHEREERRLADAEPAEARRAADARAVEASRRQAAQAEMDEAVADLERTYGSGLVGKFQQARDDPLERMVEQARVYPVRNPDGTIRTSAVHRLFDRWHAGRPNARKSLPAPQPAATAASP